MTCEERARKDLEQDRKDAENELQRYEDAGDTANAQQISYVSGRCVIIPFHYHMSDLLQKKEHVFPLLFHVAMDVLSAQASSVPSECISSSSKETCTLRRNCISPTMLEALQILKFIYKQERLNLQWT